VIRSTVCSSNTIAFMAREDYRIACHAAKPRITVQRRG
jgi:hypothetical protein